MLFFLVKNKMVSNLVIIKYSIINGDWFAQFSITC